MTSKTILRMWLAVSVFLLAVTGVARAQWLEQDKLLASDGADDDHFGSSVSISGDYAIVGAYWDDDNGDWSGSAYIFKREAGVWIQQAKLLASDGAAWDLFGSPVSSSLSHSLSV